MVKAINSDRGVLLVGDNPFHGISHLSQDRVKLRGQSVINPERAAELVRISLANDATGFMFSVSETTLAILNEIREKGIGEPLSLYAIVPYASDYVKLATQTGGIMGLAKVFSKQLISSGNVKAIAGGLGGVLNANPASILKTYLTYEISRIKSAAGKHGQIQSVLLHEVIVDLGLALNLDWLFKAHVDFMVRHGYTPGFNTCNFAFLVNKLKAWDIPLGNLVVAAPFNKAGFQMNPSKKECEEALRSLSEPVLIAISILAAGYLELDEAISYIASLQNVKGVAVGISKEKHAQETFRLIAAKLAK